MKKQIKLFMIIFLNALAGQTVTAQKPGNLTLNIQHVVGGQPLKLDDAVYKNSAGEKFNVTTFNYFISNIKFLGKDGTQYIVPQDSSYFLIKEGNPSSKKIKLKIPKKQFTSITFTIGVDSLRSVSDLTHRKDALDISGGMTDGMYWTWNSGYIFFKLEGESVQAAADKTGQHRFRYHIGGFGGYKKPSLNNIKIVTLDLSPKGQIDAGKNNDVTLNIQADVLKVFNGKNPLSIAKESNIMFGVPSKIVAENYSEIFSHASTLNR